jgi:hypothetical protein
MSGKPGGFPGAEHIPDQVPDDVVARLTELFGGTPTAAAKPDLSDPPGSVVTLPQEALDGSGHANIHAHIPDWFTL